MTAANPVDLETRIAADAGADIAVEMAAYEFDARAFVRDTARCLPVEIGIGAVRIQQKTEAMRMPLDPAPAYSPARRPAAEAGAGVNASKATISQAAGQHLRMIFPITFLPPSNEQSL
jgi:hypothetical protein